MSAKKQEKASLQIAVRDDGVAVLTLDVPGKAVNTLSPALLAEVEAAMDRVEGDPAVKAAVLVSGKPGCFIAGADIDILSSMQSAAEVSRLSTEGNRLLSRIADSEKPVVAAVHGAALGGGLETALACHYIIASDDTSTVLGQPEVMLGLLPAGGGTQRLPRRVGLTAALPLLLTGKRLRGRRALKMGLVDAVTTPGGIAETGARAALALAEGKLQRRSKQKTIDRLAAMPGAIDLVLKKARDEVIKKTHGLYPAPLAILDCVETGLKKGIEAGLELEARYFGELATGGPSRSLVWLFQGMNETKKMVGGPTPKKVGRLAVLGAGLMGSGIASVSLKLCPVVLRDISDEAVGKGAQSIDKGLRKQARSGAITRIERDRRWSALQLTTGLESLRGCDLVIEAVFEDLQLKRKVLAEVEQVIADDAVFASNTSALPIGKIAAGARHPERVLGMHYFSPVPAMPLLEIIVAEKTSKRALRQARHFGIEQGKTVIVVRDGSGFYTTRILATYLNEAALMLEEGARVEDLDRAMLKFGYPLGPIKLIDEVGIDVGAHVARDLGQAFEGRGGNTSKLLPRLFEAGYHGKKNQLGFYDYQAGKKGRKKPNEAIYGFTPQKKRRDFAPAEIQQRLALAMVNEAALCLQEEVIASPRDGDLGAILGLGFPPLRGGPFHHVDAVGVDGVVSELEALADRHGVRFAPAQILRDRASAGKRFFG